jgi:hypothetical protein
LFFFQLSGFIDIFEAGDPFKHIHRIAASPEARTDEILLLSEYTKSTNETMSVSDSLCYQLHSACKCTTPFT